MRILRYPYAALLAVALAVALAALAPHRAEAQPSPSDRIATSGGRLYVVAFPDTTMNTFDARYPSRAYVDKAILMIYSAVDARVSVKGRGYNNQLQTTGGSFTLVELMGGATQSAPAPLATQHCRPVDNTFRIESTEPVVVIQYLVTKFGTEAWTPAPVAAWGSEYYAAAMPGEVGSNVMPNNEETYARRNKMFPAEILVIAAYDDTRITIVPNGQVHTSCSAENVTLKAGEAYQIQSFVDTNRANPGVAQPDFGGSRIVATKPVGVITGNTRAQLVDLGVGLEKNSFKNMQIEWLAPVEQWGTEFVYTPTWDARRPTGAPGEDPERMRPAEFVRVYGASDTATAASMIEDGAVVAYDSLIDRAEHGTIRHAPDRPRVHRTDRPAQATMHSAATARYAGTTNGSSGVTGTAYDGFGGYMVTLTPREQWVSFAPFYASSHPGGMEHFVNVVTDSAHRDDIYLKSGARFEFNRGAIEGTDLIWGTMSVAPGVDNHLEGRNGARFAGHVYGGLSKGGHEEFRPGRIRGEEQPPAVMGGALHPAEYEEYLAIAYGYPLVSARRVNAPADSLRIETIPGCAGTCLTITSVDDDPQGLRSVELELADNATISEQTPFPITGATSATVCIVPIDRDEDASATVVITDRTGAVTRVPFQHRAEVITTDRSSVQFGAIPTGSTSTQMLTVSNLTERPIVIERATLLFGNQDFAIVEPTAFPVTIAAGASLPFHVLAAPTRPDYAYVDTLFIATACSTLRIPLLAETQEPCVNVHDLDFGTLQPGESRTMTLRISNDGGGEVRFTNPSGEPLITWADSLFDIAPQQLARLETVVLRRGDVVDVAVTFTASAERDITDTARIWASTRRCRDVSVWTARVTVPTAVPTGTGASFALESAQPNPATSTTTIGFSLERPSHATLTLYDERGGRVMTLVDELRAAGAHAVTLDVASLPAGVYHYRLSAGGASLTRSLVRR